jgi:seryl-tRNA synthetase
MSQDHQQTSLILQRQELLIEKAVSEYNKLLARYNDLLQKQAADRQLMHSQALLLQSKDDAMRALNSRVVELEKKVQSQAKEIGMVKSKAAEDKEQAFAEAHAHEKAKQQMAQVVSQMQDSEKDLKLKLNQAL